MNARLRSDRGTTMPELLVTMLILSIVIAATTTLTIGFQRANGANLARQDQIDSVRAGIQAISGTMRSAVKPAQLPACAAATCPEEAFIQASAFNVRFYANINNANNVVGPSRVEYSVVTTGPDAGQLIETIQRPDSNVPGPSGSYEYCDATLASASAACKARYSSHPIAFGVLTDGAPLFRYFNQAGTEMVPPTGSSLGSADMSHMLGVEVHVRAGSTTSAVTDPTEVVQRLTLPNAAALIRQLEEETP